MKIANEITYSETITSTNGQKMRRERAARIVRPYKLTHRGAERILRRQLFVDPSVSVVRVESAILS